MARVKKKKKKDLECNDTSKIKVVGRYWDTLAHQWRGIGFRSMEDAEEYETLFDIPIHSLVLRSSK